MEWVGDMQSYLLLTYLDTYTYLRSTYFPGVDVSVSGDSRENRVSEHECRLTDCLSVCG